MHTRFRFPSKYLAALFIAALIVAPTAPALANEGPASFADLAARLLPAVVNISTTQTISSSQDMQDMPDLQLPPGSPFEEFFKDFMNKYKEQKHKATSLGSGFIIDPAGYIVTNYHVIED
ncbi:MAG TPA: serine protease, partial [Alphaproteobacteria bacterium]|nr:serine protease [Alphaproteobacteria bacterium]